MLYVEWREARVFRKVGPRPLEWEYVLIADIWNVYFANTGVGSFRMSTLTSYHLRPSSLQIRLHDSPDFTCRVIVKWSLLGLSARGCYIFYVANKRCSEDESVDPH
jgi:hypothetical protein